MSGRVVIELAGEAVGKQRPRLSKHGVYTPPKTKAFETALGYQARAVMRGRGGPIADPVSVRLDVELRVPRSWSARKRLAAINGDIRPTGRPDADNILKAVLDGLAGIVFVNDAAAVKIGAVKRYGAEPKLTIVVEPLLELRRSI